MLSGGASLSTLPFRRRDSRLVSSYTSACAAISFPSSSTVRSLSSKLFSEKRERCRWFHWPPSMFSPQHHIFLQLRLLLSVKARKISSPRRAVCTGVYTSPPEVRRILVNELHRGIGSCGRKPWAVAEEGVLQRLLSCQPVPRVNVQKRLQEVKCLFVHVRGDKTLEPAVCETSGSRRR